MSVYDVESLTSLANLIAPYVSLVLASKHKKEVSSIDLVTDFTNLYSLPCYYWNRQTGVKRPVNVAVSDLISTVETAANEELIKIKEMAKDSAESANMADLAALLSALSAAESAATALDLKNQTIDYLNTVKDDETTRIANENTRLANELERKTNESGRIDKENIRRSNEDIRILNENERISNENERKSLEITRLSNEALRLDLELDREDAETIRNSNENTRKSLETTRLNNESTRLANETIRLNNESNRQLNEDERVSLENSRVLSEASRVEAENIRVLNETNRVETENLRKETEDTREANELNRQTKEAERQLAENNREEQFNVSKEAADLAADRANDVASHQPYIGEDLYWYLYDESTKSYNKTTKYSKGDNFSVKATFSSIAEMEAYVNPSVETASNPILKIGDFILIVNDVELEDNAKLYVVSKVTSTKITFDYIADFSGARGFTGHTPLISIGNVTSLGLGELATATLSEDGIDTEGNPKYKLNLGLPKGDKFIYSDFTEEQLALLEAGFGLPTASIDNNTGIPNVQINVTGTNREKIFDFVFKNLKGEIGKTPNINIGNTTTGESGTYAQVILDENSTVENPIFNFVIPKGDKGDKGDTGESGVVTPINSFFTMSVDDDGNLWVHTSENVNNAPEFEYNESTGELYLVTQD